MPITQTDSKGTRRCQAPLTTEPPNPDSPTPQGLLLDYVRAYRVVVSCPAGGTITAGGTLQAWYCDPLATSENSLGSGLGRWIRSPELDLSLTSNGSTDAVVFPDVEALVPTGRVYFQSQGVSASKDGVSAPVTLTLVARTETK